MNATFVQVDAAKLSLFKRDPSSVEALFQGESSMPDAVVKLSKVMQDRVRAAGPEMLAGSLSKLDPALQQRLAERLGTTPEQWAPALTGDEILKLMEQRRPSPSARPHAASRIARSRSTRNGTAFTSYSAAKSSPARHS